MTSLVRKSEEALYNDLTSYIKAAYTSASSDERTEALQLAINELKRLERSLGVQCDWNRPLTDNTGTMTVEGSLIPANPDVKILKLITPQNFTPYQNFEIQIQLQNTGNNIWRHHVIMLDEHDNPGPSGPGIQPVEIPELFPNNVCTVIIPASSRGTDGKFNLNLCVYQDMWNGHYKPLYKKPLCVIPVHVDSKFETKMA